MLPVELEERIHNTFDHLLKAAMDECREMDLLVGGNQVLCIADGQLLRDRLLVFKKVIQRGRGCIGFRCDVICRGARVADANAAGAFIVLLGRAFVVLGCSLALGSRTNVVGTPYIRLFGIRDAFLGAYTLLLLMRNETRALFLLLAAALLLPIADTFALADSIGWARTAVSNLPFELPLMLALALVRRVQGISA